MSFALALSVQKLLDSSSAEMFNLPYSRTMFLSLLPKPLLSFGLSFIPKELADPRRILLTHFGNIADIVRSIPVLVALRHRFPLADIAWLIEEQAAPLVLDHWGVNRLIIVPSDWYKRISDIRQVRQRLRSFAPQVAVNPQNSFGSSLAVWFSGAKYRIGFGAKQARHLHNIHIIADTLHSIERNLHLLQPLGIFGSSIGFDTPECEKDTLAAQHILNKAGLHGNFAMLHVSADYPSARWSEERFGKVAKYLREQWNLPSLITWSNSEESSRAVVAVHAADGAALQAPWQTTLIERKSLAQLATLFVGSDTAELQLAGAVGTRCVGLFGPTSALENMPFGLEHRMVQSSYQGTLKKRKQMTASEWMDAITPKLVCEQCDEVLSELLQPNVLPWQAASSKKTAA